METLRVLISGMAALILAILGPPLFVSLQHGAKATGLAALQVFAPSSAILAIVFFSAFFAASRLHSKALRLLLFWTPATVVLTLGLAFIALIVYARLYVPKG